MYCKQCGSLMPHTVTDTAGIRYYECSWHFIGQSKKENEYFVSCGYASDGEGRDVAGKRVAFFSGTRVTQTVLGRG